MNHYGGPFGSEGKQTSLPSCMNRMHRNYMWSSKTVPGSTVCDRAGACGVHNRVSSNIAKVDRAGQVVSSGATPMEAAVMSRGGRVPETVVNNSGAAVSSAGYPSVCGDPRNIISAKYIEAAASAGQQQQQQQQYAAAAAATRSVSSIYSSASGFWGFAFPSAASASSSGANGASDGMYTYMDEEYMRCMQTHMGWDRDNGIIHLMPIAVVYQEDVL